MEFGTIDSPFLANADVGGIALLILGRLLGGLVELLIETSTVGHQILLHALQAGEDIAQIEVEASLLDMLLLGRNGTSECQWQQSHSLKNASHFEWMNKRVTADLQRVGTLGRLKVKPGPRVWFRSKPKGWIIKLKEV